jgi:hypothetical protein
MKNMKRQMFLYSFAAMLAFGLTSSLVKGGSPIGSLAGEVTDPSGAVVPGAKILISSDHWSETLSTDHTGQYVVTGLAPGMYEVAVSSDGFAPFERVGLVVSTGDRTKMDATLDLATLKQMITVTADARSR